MGDHRGKEGSEGEPERHVADALAGVKAWGLHGVWVVWWWAQNSEHGLTLAAGYGLGGAGLYRMKPGSAARAFQVAQAPAQAIRHSATL